MLPGFSRTQWAPASIAFSASVWLKWMSAITGIGDCATIVFSASASCSRGHRHAHDVGAGLGDRADLLHRRREVGGLGLGHRLHGDGRAAADRDRADLNLALGGHRLILRCPDVYATARRPAGAPAPRPLRRPRPRARATPASSRSSRLPAGARVLDVGCGALGLRALEPELDITGVDLARAPRLSGAVRARRRRRGAAVRRRRVRPRVLLERDRARRRRRAAAAFAAELRRVGRGWFVQTPGPLVPDRAALAAARRPLAAAARCAGATGGWARPATGRTSSCCGRGELEALFGPARPSASGRWSRAGCACARRPA